MVNIIHRNKYISMLIFVSMILCGKAMASPIGLFASGSHSFTT